MRKLKSKAGFTLMETMVSVLILVLIAAGMGTGMDAGLSVYKESTMEYDSASLANLVNTAAGDVLRYAEDIKEVSVESGIDFVFTNREYGVADAYFYIGDGIESDWGTLYLKNIRNNDTVDLLSSGAYPNLRIANFKISYEKDNAYGAYFELEYDIFNQKDSDQKRHITSIVRHLNAE